MLKTPSQIKALKLKALLPGLILDVASKSRGLGSSVLLQLRDRPGTLAAYSAERFPISAATAVSTAAATTAAATAVGCLVDSKEVAVSSTALPPPWLRRGVAASCTIGRPCTTELAGSCSECRYGGTASTVASGVAPPPLPPLPPCSETTAVGVKTPSAPSTTLPVEQLTTGSSEANSPRPCGIVPCAPPPAPKISGLPYTVLTAAGSTAVAASRAAASAGSSSGPFSGGSRDSLLSRHSGRAAAQHGYCPSTGASNRPTLRTLCSAHGRLPSATVSAAAIAVRNPGSDCSGVDFRSSCCCCCCCNSSCGGTGGSDDGGGGGFNASSVCCGRVATVGAAPVPPKAAAALAAAACVAAHYAADDDEYEAEAAAPAATEARATSSPAA
ncbi:hypothetical protein VOLCADRAFT_101240 [Volvox carteri f. nagariensis]|uniref:Uncharacterized protein n=1 Tax=Volvox carteri f. nagariensis TaxID=3068 RepID=D8UM38_VOLCA|nr:uncharacterized protein VOLCADRAFT_101240 [Volvox carteri f. nagariensis]EFJ39211.1 hypothetical protein VOLCADRAFT_101240 [Volvox carteri f. nagariensis]|eukprot:XP_002959723.1 hypothetical protein VOLCADRAFT_101240 [Volvox carteri f. nagariensis]